MKKIEQKDIMKVMKEHHLPVPIVLRSGLSTASIMAVSTIVRERQMAMATALYRKLDKMTNRDYLLRRYASNNWLKMHGYPMRRKRR